MKSEWNGIDRRTSLRIAAETLVANLSPDTTARPVEALMHELIVHKIELEMQYDELRRTQNAQEEALDRYRDLYEFAPVGYLTISPESLISEINLTGCELLGVARHALVNRHFSTFVASPDRDLWHRQFIKLLVNAEGERQAFDLQMTKADGTVFSAHLDCVCKKTQDTAPILLVALTDIGNINRP